MTCQFASAHVDLQKVENAERRTSLLFLNISLALSSSSSPYLSIMASKRSFQTLLNTTRVAYTNRLINPARARVRSTLPSISPIWTNSPLQQRIRWKSTTSSTQPETNNPGSKTVVNQEDQEDVGLIDNSAPSKGQPIGKIEQRL